MSKIILQTERTYLRELTYDDAEALSETLQDEKAMYAYEHAFSDEEVREWLERQLKRYEKYGFGLWAVILKETGEFIGQCGITMQDTGGAEVYEVGYLLCRRFWHKGYAAEAAGACMEYGFSKLGANEIYSIIREGNISSVRVAQRNGMTPKGTVIKHYYGIDMPHTLYSKKI